MGRDSRLVIEPGQVVADRYRLEGPIERGAMGAVWRATHVLLESPVAIKFLNPAIADDPDMLKRFLREAQAGALVRSSHVVQVFDYGVERGTPYIAMELLIGESLDSRLDRQGVLSPAELDKIFGEVAQAVAVAHEVGVIHRDLKPGNVFIVREGEKEITKVLDFGIAKLDPKQPGPTRAGTHSGVTLGTPHYMSPEQARGERGLDHRTDFWSLAVMAFECLTGTSPFRGESFGDLIVNICTLEPVLPSALVRVPKGFDAWFLKGVMKDPEARFANAQEMASALHDALSSGATTSGPTSQTETELMPGPALAAYPRAGGGLTTKRLVAAFAPATPLHRRTGVKLLVAALALSGAVVLGRPYWEGRAPSVTPVLAPAQGEVVVAHATPTAEPTSEALAQSEAVAKGGTSSTEVIVYDAEPEPLPQAEPAPSVKQARPAPTARRARSTKRAPAHTTAAKATQSAAKASQTAAAADAAQAGAVKAAQPTEAAPAAPTIDPFTDRL